MTRLERLEEIRKRAEKATPGPWRAVSTADGDTDGAAWVGTERSVSLAQGYDGEFLHRPDAEFMANAREDIPWLLAEVARTQGALEQLTEGHEADCRQRIRGGEARCNCSVGISRAALGMTP